jgi:hypothetical protein
VSRALSWCRARTASVGGASTSCGHTRGVVVARHLMQGMTLSPIDVPPVTTEHSAQILGDAFPTTSETGTVESVLTLFRRAAESVGTSNTAEVMFALIEANATGQTPTELIGEFTADQRTAFDRTLRQLNMGQGASVMAQDILNTKMQLNGVVTTFEAAVQELIASYGATGAPSPRSQAEFQQKYRGLLDKAKEAAKQIGDNHRNTQDSLVSGVRKGAVPQIPSTMAPTSSSNPIVPGMPDNALGSMLQNVAGVMSKPPNLPMPNIGQAIQPAAQSAQSAISELMNKLPGKAVPISDDALSKLTTSAGLVNQSSSLSNPRSHGAPRPDSHHGSPAPGTRAPLSGAHGGENNRHMAHPGGEDQPADEDAPTEVTATTPTSPATTSGHSESVPAVTLSSGQSATGTDSLHAPDRRTSPIGSPQRHYRLNPPLLASDGNCHRDVVVITGARSTYAFAGGGDGEIVDFTALVTAAAGSGDSAALSALGYSFVGAA